jgi:NADPH:quinone reductase-like Zn-dependent oxidoreductase
VRALVFGRHGDPAEVLELVQVPDPVPARGQVRVRVYARPINPSDLLYIEGRYGRVPDRFPAVAGFEAVGVIDAVGPGVELAIGTRAAVSAPGTWQEYALAEPEDLLPVPDSLPDVIACQTTVNPCTAVLLLREMSLAPGSWIALSAAGSAVARMVLVLAHRAGLRCVCAVRGRHHHPDLLALGADLVIDTDDRPLADTLRERVPDGVDVVLDAVGGEIGSHLVRTVRPGGQVLSYGLLSGHPFHVDPARLVFDDIRVNGFWLPLHLARLDRAARDKVATDAVRLLTEPPFADVACAEFDLASVEQAIRWSRTPRHGAKTILTG